MAWESSGRWAKCLGPCTHVGDLEEAPGSWLQIDLAPAVAAIWGVNQQMKDPPPSLFLSASLCNFVFQLNKINLLKKEKVPIYEYIMTKLCNRGKGLDNPKVRV